MSTGNKRPLLFSLVIAAALSLFPISSQAAVFWDDELEPGNTGYDISGLGGIMSYDSSTKISGSGSLRLDYPSICLTEPTPCGGFRDRAFTATNDLWVRFYIRLSSGFLIANSTKVMRHDWTDATLSGWWVMHFGSNVLKFDLQNYPILGSTRSFAPNTGDGALPTDGTWHCIEAHIKNNAMGSADGLIEAWKDGNQFMSYTGLTIRRTNDLTNNLLMNSNRMYRQAGSGTISYDKLAFGNTRIGCLGVTAQSDTTPPASPSGLTIR